MEFIDDVLIASWPKWEFNEHHRGQWGKRLWKFDFAKAKAVILDFAFKYVKPGHPPAGQIMAILYKAAMTPKEMQDTDTVQLYSIIRSDGRRAGFPVSSARGIPANVEAVQKEAEDLRARIAGNREGYCIQWLCEAVAPSVPF